MLLNIFNGRVFKMLHQQGTNQQIRGEKKDDEQILILQAIETPEQLRKRLKNKILDQGRLS